jgi:hypothetical protein
VDDVTFHPSHVMLSVQPGSSMSMDKIHDSSLQSEWIMLLFNPHAILSVQPGSSMSTDKIYDISPQSEWSMLLFIPPTPC